MALAIWAMIMIPIEILLIKSCINHNKKNFKQLLEENENNIRWLKKLEKAINSSDDVSQCALDIENMIATCDKIIAINDELIKLSKMVKNENNFSQLNSDLEEAKSDLIRDKQRKMRDAIERGAHNTISDIQKKYRNSSEHQAGRFYAFCVSIENSRELFDEETNSFADNAIHEVECKTRYKSLNDISTSNPLFNDNLSEVDCMDGHSFEYWCADLLKKIGYENVNVTKGSGDQGVDIIAEKEDIHYAIQCKCYASDLGNTPVQEVHAGASFYHCQVAVVMTNRYFTKSAKELAQVTGVLLWDRDKLLQFINKAQDN